MVMDNLEFSYLNQTSAYQDRWYCFPEMAAHIQ